MNLTWGVKEGVYVKHKKTPAQSRDGGIRFLFFNTYSALLGTRGAKSTGCSVTCVWIASLVTSITQYLALSLTQFINLYLSVILRKRQLNSFFFSPLFGAKVGFFPNHLFFSLDCFFLFFFSLCIHSCVQCSDGSIVILCFWSRNVDSIFYYKVFNDLHMHLLPIRWMEITLSNSVA